MKKLPIIIATILFYGVALALLPPQVRGQDPNVGGSVKVKDRMTSLEAPRSVRFTLSNLRETLLGIEQLQKTEFRLSQKQLQAIKPTLERAANGAHSLEHFSQQVKAKLNCQQRDYVNYLEISGALNNIPVFNVATNSQEEALMKAVTAQLKAKAQADKS